MPVLERGDTREWRRRTSREQWLRFLGALALTAALVAASATILALIWSALCSVMTLSNAEGIRMSHFMVSKSSLEIREAPGIPTTVPERSL